MKSISLFIILTLVLIAPQMNAQTYKPLFAKPLLIGIGATPTGGVSINANPASTPFALQLPLDDGMPNEVLVTDGTGLLSWTSLPTALTHFTEALTTTVPNDLLPVASLTATNVATNVDAALAPKGTGALLGAIPDNAVTGGDKRGTYAVDWQLLRTTSTQVASGSRSTISGGSNNTASSNHSTVSGGENNTIEASFSNHATIGGGISNHIDGGDFATIGGGVGNDIVASSSATIGGGDNNLVSNSSFSSTIGGGWVNTIENNSNNATIGGGASNRIDYGSENPTISGGRNNDIGHQATSSSIGGGFDNNIANFGSGSTISGGRFNRINGENSAIAGGRGLTLDTSAFGFLGNNLSGTRNATVHGSNIVFFGNTDLWLANNDNAPSALRFYEAQSTSGAFPAAGTNFAALVAPTLAANYTLTLPTDDGTPNQVLTTDGSGTLSWTEKHILTSTSDAGDDAGIALTNAGVIEVIVGSATGNFNVTLPGGTTGQVMYVYNNSSFQITETITGVNIANGAGQQFVNVPNVGWKAF